MITICSQVSVQSTKLNFLIQQDKIKTTTSSLQFSEVENELQTECNRNPLSKALLLMHMAGQAVTSRSHVGTERQAQLLQVQLKKSHISVISYLLAPVTHSHFCITQSCMSRFSFLCNTFLCIAYSCF